MELLLILIMIGAICFYLYTMKQIKRLDILRRVDNHFFAFLMAYYEDFNSEFYLVENSKDCKKFIKINHIFERDKYACKLDGNIAIQLRLNIALEKIDLMLNEDLKENTIKDINGDYVNIESFKKHLVILRELVSKNIKERIISI